MIDSELLSTRIVLSKVSTENWSRKTFTINAMLQTSPQTYKTKDLKGEKLKNFIKNNRIYILAKIRQPYQ